jgi:hypothetical protein
VLSLADCAPETFTRVNGRALDQQQLLNDEAICRGEIKNNLSTDNQTTTPVLHRNFTGRCVRAARRDLALSLELSAT